MGFFKWFKKKKENAPVENTQANEVEVSVTEESNVEETQTVEENKNEDVVEAVVSTDDEVEVVEESVDETETIAEEVSEIEDTVEKEEVAVEKTEVEEAVQEIPEENVEPVEVEETEEVAVEEQPTEEEKPKGFFAKIKAGLSKTRNNIISSVENVLSAFTKIDEDLYEELEEALIMADIGVETSLYIIEKLREKVKDEKIHDPAEVKGAIIRVITEILEKDDEPFELPHPSVVLVIGVNGVGKTTTIGKLTHNYMENGKTVLLAAADTFRAAAIDQLQVWADRNNAQLIKHQENSDPGAVVYDAVQAAKARNTDVLICDTAGRLHNKKNLMEELRKISKIVNKEYPDAKVETLLVLDATTGQNALQQAKLFKEVADITGLVLTKLDGTAKGGIVLAIKHEMNIPVRYIGVGEQMDDLQEFNSKDFAKALFDEE